MRPDQKPAKVAERLLILTLALGEAAQRGDNSELRALFGERAKILAYLETCETGPEVLATLRKVQLAELETQGKFLAGKSAAVRDMEKGLHGKRVKGAYAARSGYTALDFNG